MLTLLYASMAGLDLSLGQLSVTAIQIHPGVASGSQRYFVGSDMVLEVLRLTNAFSETLIDDATVAVALVDRAGANVSGQSWSEPMAAVGNGNYRLLLSRDLAVQPNTHVMARVTATAGALRGRWEVPIWVTTRER